MLKLVLEATTILFKKILVLLLVIRVGNGALSHNHKALKQ